MTLSLEDVRNKRFRMARKSGYEVLEVDEFVDEVETAFEQLLDENANLKKQVDALKSAPQSDTSAQSAPTSPATPPRVEPTPAPAAQPTATAQPSGSAPIVVTTSKEASSAVVRLVELSTDQAEKLVSEATEDATRIRDEANRNAHQVTTDARTRAERIESEARVNAERVQGDALGRAEALDRDLENRRGQMFGDLERQRDELSSSVEQLRTFEADFRSNLTTQLRQHIDTIEKQRAEPADAPGLAGTAAAAPNGRRGEQVDTDAEQSGNRQDSGPATSETPRLDALLGDQH